jgi:hypothetical protein
LIAYVVGLGNNTSFWGGSVFTGGCGKNGKKQK